MPVTPSPQSPCSPSVRGHCPLCLENPCFLYFVWFSSYLKYIQSLLSIWGDGESLPIAILRVDLLERHKMDKNPWLQTAYILEGDDKHMKEK